MEYKLHKKVLDEGNYQFLINYLRSVSFNKIENENYLIETAFYGNNLNNKEVDKLINKLSSFGLFRYLNFNELWIVKYSSGNDFIGWHSDSGIHVDDDKERGILSLGNSKKIEFRTIGNIEPEKFVIQEPGDLLIMDKDFQKKYQHRIVKGQDLNECYSIVLCSRG